ncbi:MAG: hypothetical protein Q8Q56_00135 [Alphaproteobacteria bacterium]|nr:hypothetical protein [Alphaproteobacteria bacterium]
MRLVAIDSCDLKSERFTNVRIVSGRGSISGHLKIGVGAPYITWGVFLKFEDGERSINAYWKGIDGLRSFAQLKGKSIRLTMDEKPDDEDFGYYYNFHKGLHRLRIDVLDIVGKEIQVYVSADRNTEDDELEEDESRYDYIEGNFTVSFDGVHIQEHTYPGSLNFLDHSEMKEMLSRVVDVGDYNGPFYSFGDPYSKKGSCLFEWNNSAHLRR